MSAEMVVVDASFVVRLVLASEELHPAVRQWREWQSKGVAPAAPALMLVEVANALHQYERAGRLTSEEVDDAMAIALRLDIRLVENDDLHRRALTIARQVSLPALYDPHYLALAKQMDCSFFTFDKRLHRSAGETLPFVQLIT